MASLKEHFAIKNYEQAESYKEAICIGRYYRITVLSDVLLRLEYSPTGTFEDRPTELVEFRRFPVPKFFIKEPTTTSAPTSIGLTLSTNSQ